MYGTWAHFGLNRRGFAELVGIAQFLVFLCFFEVGIIMTLTLNWGLHYVSSIFVRGHNPNKLDIENMSKEIVPQGFLCHLWK